MENMIPIVLFICVAAVLVLRPITRPLGRLLEAMAKDHRVGAPPRAGATPLDERTLERVTDLLDRLNTRLDMVEERMQFVERLMDHRDVEPSHRIGELKRSSGAHA
jgi:hypothetical protein